MHFAELQEAFNRPSRSPDIPDLGTSGSLLSQGGRVPERHGMMTTEGSGGGLVLSFPYAAMIRAHLEREQISAAKKLLEIALRQKHSDSSLAVLQMILAPARISTGVKRSVDHSDDYRWLATHGEAYQGQWVALSGGELHAHAGSLRELAALLKEQPTPCPPLVVRLEEKQDA